jgi:hypothetical protein
MRVYRSDQVSKRHKEQVPALLFIVWISPPGYPSAWLRPGTARFRFARQDNCSSTPSIGLNFRKAPNPFRVDANRGDHFLQAID